MLLERLYQPADSDLIYHYCSAATFQAIVESGRLRFSDINMLSDASEVRWAYSVFEEAATRLVKRTGIPADAPSVELAFIDAIDAILSPSQLVVHPFVACFSREADVLGQWRAYADDGRGFAIGFRASTLKEQLPATFLEATYDREEQVKEMIVGIVATHLKHHDGSKLENRQFREDCMLLATLMIAFKHPAFRDEKEIRAVHLVRPEPQGTLMKFIDPGGVVGGVEVGGNTVAFHVRDNHLVAHVDITFTPSRMTSPLVDLFLGPRNHSSPASIAFFLGGNGLENVALHHSNVPYR